MKNFTIDLDDFAEEIFHEMERIQDGGSGHKCLIKADCQKDATNKLLERLASFIHDSFYETDKHGNRLT